jgi:hypothetical protein
MRTLEERLSAAAGALGPEPDREKDGDAWARWCGLYASLASILRDVDEGALVTVETAREPVLVGHRDGEAIYAPGATTEYRIVSVRKAER